MLHACVERFDVMGERWNILGWDGEVNKAHMHEHDGPWLAHEMNEATPVYSSSNGDKRTPQNTHACQIDRSVCEIFHGNIWTWELGVYSSAQYIVSLVTDTMLVLQVVCETEIKCFWHACRTSSNGARSVSLVQYGSMHTQSCIQTLIYWPAHLALMHSIIRLDTT
jgi:hypothetical protein